MEEFLKLAEKKGASYAEIHSSEIARNAIEIADKDVKEMSSGDAKLYSVRLIHGNKVGMAYSYLPEFKKLIEKAIKNTKANDVKVKFPEVKAIKKEINTEFKINPNDVDLVTKKEDLLKLDIRKDFKNIVSLKLMYADSIIKRSFFNTAGNEVIWNDCNTGVIMWPFSKRGNEMQNFLKIERVKGGYEIMEKAKSSIKEAMKKAEALLDAKAAKGGLFPTIVDQKLGGVFTHEAVGHACEADHILVDGSILKGKMGEKIGNSIINMADDGRLKTWGWTPFDSEGVEACKTQLIKNGVLVGWLHSRETAGEFNEKVTGNGRAQGLDFRIIPRMTTTFIENGDSSFEEMLSEVKKGYYLKGSLGGQVDPVGGEFLFNAQEGYYVENGEVKHMVKGVSLVGKILETLNNIKLIAGDIDYGHGYCGKAGQHVPVSEGSPHLLIENAKIGGSA